MDVNSTNNIPAPTPVQPMPKQDPNGLSVASLVVGICSLVFICLGGGLILGALGIVFALLSRGISGMNTQAKVGLGLSIGGLALSTIIIPAMLLAYVPYVSGEFQEEFNKEFNRNYNETYNEIYDAIDEIEF